MAEETRATPSSSPTPPLAAVYPHGCYYFLLIISYDPHLARAHGVRVRAIVGNHNDKRTGGYETVNVCMCVCVWLSMHLNIAWRPKPQWSRSDGETGLGKPFYITIAEETFTAYETGGYVDVLKKNIWNFRNSFSS